MEAHEESDGPAPYNDNDYRSELNNQVPYKQNHSKSISFRSHPQFHQWRHIIILSPRRTAAPPHHPISSAPSAMSISAARFYVPTTSYHLQHPSPIRERTPTTPASQLAHRPSSSTRHPSYNIDRKLPDAIGYRVPIVPPRDSRKLNAMRYLLHLILEDLGSIHTEHPSRDR